MIAPAALLSLSNPAQATAAAAAHMPTLLERASDLAMGLVQKMVAPRDAAGRPAGVTALNARP